MRHPQGPRTLQSSALSWICALCRQQSRLVSKRNLSLFNPVRSSTTRRPSKQIIIGRTHRKYASDIANEQSARRSEKLPDFPARTRFAPSPTGYMHIGGLRTALFSYLLAKRTEGQFLLRIEDTDQKRFVSDAERRLCEDLLWAGLQWDEGPQVGGLYGPYKQSERTHVYQQHAQALLDSGAAYRCFCTPQTTGIGGGKAAYVTSGCYQDCSHLSSEETQDRAIAKKETFTVRLKQPVDVQKRVYKDLIYGKIQRLKRSPSASPGGEDDAGIDAADTILIKSDGTPTYHFANVVDDHAMKITHVIRGTEWMASTPLHYDLYIAFGWQPPAFAHVGLLVDENQAKLSKRSSTGLVLDVRGMREEQGILPEVLCNFLALLGWSNPGRNDVLEMKELVHDFDLKFTKGNAIVKNEKLWYLQKQHVARRCARASSADSLYDNDWNKDIKELVISIMREARLSYPDSIASRFPNPNSFENYCTEILLADSKSYQTPKQYIERNKYFFHYDPAQVTHSDSFEDGASTMAYTVLTKKILEEFDFSQPYREPVVAVVGTSAKFMPSVVEARSALIHAAIHHGIWRALANPMWLMLPAEKYKEAAATGQIPPPEQELEHVPFTDQPIDLAAYARFLGDQGANPQITIAGVEETTKAYKEWNKGMMRYLREKLSYGLPGPGVGVLMAILGYEECCRRLGVLPQRNGGWSIERAP